MKSITEIALAINAQSPSYQIGSLQQLRKQLKGLERSRSVIFDTGRPSVNESEGWAFHTGGRDDADADINGAHRHF